MKSGKALELLVSSILLNVGFSKVRSDGRYVFDGSAGQMVQGLGEAHNADVLVEPPVQTPFYTPSRLLVECKDYSKSIGLNTLRSVLGLREDINHFDIVDAQELQARQRNRRAGIAHDHRRYYYQVAVASTSGFTVAAQNFALTHRIPLIEIDKMPFWHDFCNASGVGTRFSVAGTARVDKKRDLKLSDEIMKIAKRSAVAITNDGQLLFLYSEDENSIDFADSFSLHWRSANDPWILRSRGRNYYFQLPKQIREYWLKNSHSDLERKVNAISFKATLLYNMVVYYSDEYGFPRIKMISIDQYTLEEAMNNLSE